MTWKILTETDRRPTSFGVVIMVVVVSHLRVIGNLRVMTKYP
jgi:hypothetical protein